jgi:hypothetical protein
MPVGVLLCILAYPIAANKKSDSAACSERAALQLSGQTDAFVGLRI